MNRGDVVQVVWPFSDLTGSKSRPAVVVQADYLNGLIDDTILVQITSKRMGMPNVDVEIDPVVEHWSGLSRLCYVRCTNFLTIDESLIEQTIGTLSHAAMTKVDDSLKAVLGLP